MSRSAFFGVAGNPPNFWRSEYSGDRANAPEWLHRIKLDALEIQCTYGVRMPEERVLAFREFSEKFGIILSIHGPYYINLGTSDIGKIDNSLNELRKAVELAHKIGSRRVIFHPGAIEEDRDKAISHAISALKRFEDENDLQEVCLFPEIDGVINKLGSLEDILEICYSVKRAWPCIDLAHHHARNNGCLKSKENFIAILNTIEEKLGPEALENLHFHISPVDWNKSGEKAHKAFDDVIPEPPQLFLFKDEYPRDIVFSPRYEPFIESIVERNLTPIIICEAKDSQDIGALAMKKYYKSLLNNHSS